MHLTLFAAVWMCSWRNKYDGKRYYFKHSDLNKVTLIDFNLIKKERLSCHSQDLVCSLGYFRCFWTCLFLTGAHALRRETLLERAVCLHWWEKTTWSSRPVSQAAPSKASASLEKSVLSPTTESLNGPSIVFGGTRNGSHALRHIATITCEFPRD